MTTSLLDRVADRLEQRTDPAPSPALQRFPTPGHLARHVRPDTVQTPMLDAVDAAIVQAARGEHRFWIINTPPQEGKSTRLQAAALWLLLDDPTRRIVFASYEQGLAQVSGLAVRQMIETFGSGYQGAAADPDREDVLGLGLDPSRGAATAWRLAQTSRVPSPGGVVSVGVGSALTGRPADVLIVDDPIKDAAHADSKKIRKNLKDWWESVASTRLAPDAIVIVVSTRWHEDDLAGWLLVEDDPAAPKWAHLSVSAQALAEDPNAKPPIGPDPLDREPGEWMVSARGRTAVDWEQKRKDIGRGGRWWNAMYQQRPAPPEGGIFQREWFRRDRIHTLPRLRRVVVMVDPADNTGDGDEAGIVVGGTTHTGGHVLMADYSGHYTTDGWFRRAFLAYIEHEANTLQWEVSLSGLKRTAASTWKALRTEARRLVEAWQAVSLEPFPGPDGPPPDPDVISLAVQLMAGEEDNAADRTAQTRRLIELWPYVTRLRALPTTGPHIKQPLKAVGSKTLRAELVAPLYENREVSHLGHKLSTLEHEMATWQDGQKSPNRMDAAVHLLRELSRSDGATVVGHSVGTIPRHLGIGPQRPQIPRSSGPRR